MGRLHLRRTLSCLALIPLLFMGYVYFSQLPHSHGSNDDDADDKGFLSYVASLITGQGNIQYFTSTYHTDGDSVIESDEHVQVSKVSLGDVDCYVYTPHHRQGRAGLVYIHGDGWTQGSAQKYDGLIRGLAKELGSVVLNVDYRQSPKHPYPVPLDDCEKATKELILRAYQFDVDPADVTLIGDGVGANMAAAVALRLRDEGFTPMPNAQVLIHPVTQAIDFNTPSHQLNQNHPTHNSRMMGELLLNYAVGHLDYLEPLLVNDHMSAAAKHHFYSSYLNLKLLPKKYIHGSFQPNKKANFGDASVWHQLEHIFVDPYFAPLLAKNLKGLPKTFVLTMEKDVVRDDGILYAERLKMEGGDVSHNHYEAGIHGIFTAHANTPLAQIVFSDIMKYIKEHSKTFKQNSEL